jgi:hypothetical protein
LKHETQVLLAGENSVTNGWILRGLGNDPDSGSVNLLHVHGPGETKRLDETLAIGVFPATIPITLALSSSVEMAPPMREPVGNVPLQERKTDQYVHSVIPTHPLNLKRIFRLFHNAKEKGDREIRRR